MHSFYITLHWIRRVMHARASNGMLLTLAAAALATVVAVAATSPFAGADFRAEIRRFADAAREDFQPVIQGSPSPPFGTPLEGIRDRYYYHVAGASHCMVTVRGKETNRELYCVFAKASFDPERLPFARMLDRFNEMDAAVRAAFPSYRRHADSCYGSTQYGVESRFESGRLNPTITLFGSAGEHWWNVTLSMLPPNTTDEFKRPTC